MDLIAYEDVSVLNKVCAQVLCSDGNHKVYERWNRDSDGFYRFDS
jgi:hypothetical protein